MNNNFFRGLIPDQDAFFCSKIKNVNYCDNSRKYCVHFDLLKSYEITEDLVKILD